MSNMHALERYQTQHPGANFAVMYNAVKGGEYVDQPLIWALTKRTCPPNPGETYIVPQDKQGVFVISPQGQVITYLRLAEVAQRILRREPTEPEPSQSPPKTSRGPTPMDRVKVRLQDIFMIPRVPKITYASTISRDDFRDAIPGLLEEDPDPRSDPVGECCVRWGRFLFLQDGGNIINVRRA